MSLLADRVERLFHESHRETAPRVIDDPRIKGHEALHPAAVLIAMTEREEHPGFLLLHRPSHMRAHPGQVAFPGGRIDPGEDAVEAALREAYEELGIASSHVQVVGVSDVYRTSSGYAITPVLGLVPPDIEIHPNPHEVAQWFEAPVDFVLDPANQQRKSGLFSGDMHEYIEIMWREHRIWGVTAAIIANLTERLRWHG
jgi:8-oxo-dGTP pyrophosphatase MutT (NUDIX family)